MSENITSSNHRDFVKSNNDNKAIQGAIYTLIAKECINMLSKCI